MFGPLKEYFDSLRNCPATVRKDFSRGDCLFWLNFVESQLKSSNEYILKTENTAIASFETAAEVSMLRMKIENRKNTLFIPQSANMIFDAFPDQEKQYNQHYVKKFYTILSEYLEKWSKSLDGTEVFCWMDLTSVPDWNKHVKPSLQYFSKHFNDNAIDDDIAFDETNLLCQIVQEKLIDWDNKKLTSDKRWLEIFALTTQQHRPLSNLSLLVQYAFAIPGSSTEVERLFSIINDVWGPDKPQLKLETLEAVLNVKVNSDLSCSDYFDLIKNNKRLLAQVQSTKKYQKDPTSSAMNPTHDEDDEREDNESD